MGAVSPLFAIEADVLFAEGRLEDALELCHAGLAEYPEYTSAYALKARILAALGRDEAAHETIASGLGYSVRHAALMRVASETGMNPAAAITKANISPLKQDVAAAVVHHAVEVAYNDDPAATPVLHAVETSYDYTPELEHTQLPQRESTTNLRIIEIVQHHFPHPLTWRANDAGLIPGLKYTAIKLHHPKKRSQTVTLEFPPFPDFVQQKKSLPVAIIPNILPEPEPEPESKSQTPLEELAMRLERARIPIAREDIGRNEHIAVPKFVTDTMAAIYEKQGAFGQALKAYQILARNKPENLAIYQAKINEITFRMNNQ